jgi:hypothetical protein
MLASEYGWSDQHKTYVCMFIPYFPSTCPE